MEIIINRLLPIIIPGAFDLTRFYAQLIQWKTGEEIDVKEKLKSAVCFSLYLLMVLFITIFSRTPNLSLIFKGIPLWSYVEWAEGNVSAGRSILLNIALFVPLGYFLSILLRSRKSKEWYAAVIAFFISLCIEIVQYGTCRGYFDFDDLINNCIGSVIGILLFKIFGKDKRENILAVALLIAGGIGCVITVMPGDNIPDKNKVRQFSFDVTSVTMASDGIRLRGYCEPYNRNGLSYSLLLRGTESGIIYSCNPERNDSRFNAFFQLEGEEKYEVDVQFEGYRPINTQVYIDGRNIVYVNINSVIPSGNLDGFEIDSSAILKAYSKEYDTYVYQSNGQIIWVIGSDFEMNRSTEVIYHLFTTEPDKLPEARKQLKFDNRGIHLNKSSAIQLYHGDYIVLTEPIPTEYCVTAIMVGFNIEGKITWAQYFRPATQ